MTDHTTDYDTQHDSSQASYARSFLDQLLADARLYTQSNDYKELLDFVVRLRNFAPFNAMLLQVQKPGLSYAASARDWLTRFSRWPKEGARPLLILWPFGPVALVYDVLDTKGKPLPEDVGSFFARGDLDEFTMKSFEPMLQKKCIYWCWVDAGDRNAGLIRVVKRGTGDKLPTQYRIHINQNHQPASQFSTLTHELGHLFLGHLGSDKRLNVPHRPILDHAQQELEAESVAYIVCRRNGIEPKSQTYLSSFVTAGTTSDKLDLFQIMRAGGQVEALLGLATPTQYDRPVARMQRRQ